MRKYILLLILSSFHVFSRGQMPVDIDLSGIPAATHAESIRYWFDNDSKSLSTSVLPNGSYTLDASSLMDGLHTIHFQVIDTEGINSHITSTMFLKLNSIVKDNGEKVTAKKLMYWFDDDKEPQKLDMTAGSQMLDASHLLEGLHTLHYQVICSDGTITSTYSSIFMRMNVDIDNGSIAAKSLRYWFDDSNDAITVESLSGTYMLDASALIDGLHKIHYQVVDVNGGVSAPHTAFFMKVNSKMADGKNTITSYMYWLNDKSVDNVKAEIDKPTSPYQLISLLPMPKIPIRSSNFQFESKNGEPTIYAKNEVHFRFYDAAGYWADDARSFIDYSISQKITNATVLASTQTFDRIEENGIKWFKFDAAPGDTIAFRSSQATSLQVFAPSGKEIYSTMGDKSVVYGGAHTWEEGTYYVAVHDVTGSKPNITLDYMHMDKYDVVNQDVRVVGNGGCSTITFQGNGFNSLYSVDLKDSKGNIIESIDVGHESDASTTVTFDFTGAKLGKYNAVFHFTEEDKTIANNITVEEAKDIELETKVTYSSRFLRGSSATYTVEITNKGNMTAYYVPTYIYVRNKDRNGISSIEIKGLDLPALTEGLDTELLPEGSVSYFKSIVEQHKDDLRFIKGWQIDPNTGDTISVRVCDVYICIQPQTTLSFSVNIKSTDDVFLNVAIPNEWKAISADKEKRNRLRKVSINDLIQQYCCYKERIECGMDVASIACDVVSPIIGFIGNWVPQAKLAAVAVALAGCKISIEGDRLKAFGESLCNPDEESALKKMLIAAYKARTTMPSLGTVLSCVGSVLGGLGLPAGKAAEALNMLSNSLSAGALFNDNINIWGGQTSCSSIGKEKPNCPPDPGGGGGTSTPVSSLDPNDIYGYVAQSGSKFIGEEVINIPYRIEFENDTTFATASAHTVIVKDTLDASKFDLASYKPTSIKIGDKDVQLNGDKTFVTTVDMRPAINTIAQVEGLYDAQKGIATWKFTSLDPMTMEETDDVMQGFLPVNFDGSGIGEVAFNIDRLPNLVDGTEINNKASIVFDSNDAIETPVWTNIIDAVPPISGVSKVEQMNDSIVRVHLDGYDNRSGTWKYALYVQYGKNTSWNQICETDTICYDFRFYDNIDNGFCVVATDSAGNVEKKIIQRECSFVNGEDIVTEVITPSKETEVTINKAYDLSGRLIQEEGYRGVIIKNRKKSLRR